VIDNSGSPELFRQRLGDAWQALQARRARAQS
jgi:hypothetical protein